MYPGIPAVTLHENGACAICKKKNETSESVPIVPLIQATTG